MILTEASSLVLCLCLFRYWWSAIYCLGLWVLGARGKVTYIYTYPKTKILCPANQRNPPNQPIRMWNFIVNRFVSLTGDNVKWEGKVTLLLWLSILCIATDFLVLPGLIRTGLLKLTASGRGFERNIAILTREIFAVIDEVSIDWSQCDSHFRVSIFQINLPWP